jgi:hypothetical protein
LPPPCTEVFFLTFLKETIDLYDELEVMIKIVRPDLDDLEFMGGSYELNQSNINYFEKKLGRKFDFIKNGFGIWLF